MHVIRKLRKNRCGCCVVVAIVVFLVVAVTLLSDVKTYNLAGPCFRTHEVPQTGVRIQEKPDRVTRSPDYIQSLLKLLPCDWTPDMFIKPTRIQSFLHCSQSVASISYREVQSDLKPSMLSSNDSQCLKDVIKQQCSDVKRRIPRVVHYIRFGEFNMARDGFISVVSVARFIQPCLILFHGDVIPFGPYWNALLHLLPNLLLVKIERPRQIFNKKIKVVQHSADVARLQILIEYGGVYADNDHVVLRSVDDLMNESAVISVESPREHSCGNGFLLAEPDSQFLHIWLDNYKDFSDKKWAVHSTLRPCKLAKAFPKLVRVVNTFFQPSYDKMDPFFNRKKVPHHDWTDQYGFHFYSRKFRSKIKGKTPIDKQDNVIGDAVRYILHGDPHACLN